MINFIVNLPTPGLAPVYAQCRDILEHYFRRHHLPYFFLEQHDYKVHPSWLKLKCFDYVKEDFVLCWDMDLLPWSWCPSIKDRLDFKKINLVADTMYLKEPDHPLFKDYPYFRYNCGLMGLPRRYRPLLEEIFAKASPEHLAQEQFPMNEALGRNNYADVHELDPTWNYLSRYYSLGKAMTNCVHYNHDDLKVNAQLRHDMLFSKDLPKADSTVFI